MKKYIKLYEEYKMERTISNIEVNDLGMQCNLLAIHMEDHIYYVYLYERHDQGIYKYKFNKGWWSGKGSKAYEISLVFTDGSDDSYGEYIVPPAYKETDANWINTIDDKHFILDKNLCRLISNADDLELDISAMYKIPQIAQKISEVYFLKDINNKSLEAYTQQVRYEDKELDLSSVANELRGTILESGKLYDEILKLGIDLDISDDVKSIVGAAMKGNHKLR